MKKTILATALVAVLLISGVIAGCEGILIGSGDLETKDYSFSDFSKVEISSAFDFEISRSDSYAVSVTADDNILEYVRVSKTGDTLRIGLGTIASLGPVTLEAVVTMPQLKGLEISGATHGTISGFSSMEDLDIEVSGTSKVTGDIIAGDTTFDISGASTVQLEGSASNLVADVSGASRCNLGGFTVGDADFTLSGASTGSINVNGKLDADVSGASKLTYSGEPTMGDISTSGASTLSKK